MGNAEYMGHNFPLKVLSLSQFFAINNINRQNA